MRIRSLTEYIKGNWKALAILFGIFLLATFFRVYHLDTVPPHPLHDEVSNGYNAYSLLKTGADEFGTKLPLLLRAYDDWRPALYTYFSIPFVAIFNLNITSIRLPSVVLSLASLVVMYFLLEQIIIQHDKKLPWRIFALSTAFLYAISPWNIYLSRISNEANLSFFSTLFALLAFFSFINKKREWYFFLSCISFALAFDAYNAIKIFLPLFFVSLLLLYYKSFPKKTLGIGVGLFLLFVLPYLFLFFQPHSAARLSDVSIFSQPRNLTSQSAARLVADRIHNDVFGMLVDNRRLDYFYTFTNNYLNNLNPLWLFTDVIRVQNSYFGIPNFGLFYLFEFPLLLYGIYVVIAHNILSKKIFILLLLWIGLGILPSAITIESPQANRTLHMLPAYLLFQGIGLGYLYLLVMKIKNTLTRLFLLSIKLVAIVFSVLWFGHAYFANFPRENSQQFDYGVTQAIDFAKTHEQDYAIIQISTESNAIRSSTFYVFEEKYNPSLYQKSGGSISGYYGQEHRIGKYVFAKPNFVSYDNNHQEVIDPHFFSQDSVKTLYIISPSEYPPSKIPSINTQYFRRLADITYLDGTDALWVMERITK